MEPTKKTWRNTADPTAAATEGQNIQRPGEEGLSQGECRGDKKREKLRVLIMSNTRSSGLMCKNAEVTSVHLKPMHESLPRQGTEEQGDDIHAPPLDVIHGRHHIIAQPPANTGCLGLDTIGRSQWYTIVINDSPLEKSDTPTKSRHQAQ
jgi:hypothetical protein